MDLSELQALRIQELSEFAKTLNIGDDISGLNKQALIVKILEAQAKKDGANGLMIRPPSFIKTSPFLHEEFYFKIANSVNIPIFMQDQNDASISGEQALKISDLHENLSYIKLESMPTIPKFDFCNNNSSREKLILFGGGGGLFFLEELRRGSSGTMPGSTLFGIYGKKKILIMPFHFILIILS